MSSVCVLQAEGELERLKALLAASEVAIAVCMRGGAVPIDGVVTCGRWHSACVQCWWSSSGGWRSSSVAMQHVIPGNGGVGADVASAGKGRMGCDVWCTVAGAGKGTGAESCAAAV